MGAEQRFGQAARFEQCETQKHRVSHAGPDGSGHIAADCDILDENGIDAHADHNQKRLKRQGEQGF